MATRECRGNLNISGAFNTEEKLHLVSGIPPPLFFLKDLMDMALPVSKLFFFNSLLSVLVIVLTFELLSKAFHLN